MQAAADDGLHQHFGPTTRAYTLTGQEVEISGAHQASVPRSIAMSIPALMRAVTLKVTTVAGLEWERIDRDGNRIDLGWLAQPEPGRARFATLCDLGYDLIFNGVSYLRVNKRTASGEPAIGGLEYVALNRVQTYQDAQGIAQLMIDGKPVQRTSVMGFQGWHDGILNHGARTIRMALALEAAALRYANSPLPSERLVNKSDYELADEEIDALLLDYKRARNSEGVAYVNSSIDVQTVGFDAKQLQLIEGRQFVNAAMCDLVGIDPAYVAGAAAGTNGTIEYANITQNARSLVDYGLKDLVVALESRMSLSDSTGDAWATQMTPRGTSVRANMDSLLRGNALERAQLWQILLPLGVVTLEQVQAYEDLAPVGKANR